jgi:peptidyl-dipeptidase Dcp
MRNLHLIFITSSIFISANLPNVEKSKQKESVVIQKSKENINMSAENNLLKDWTGPFQGVPPLDKVKVSDFKPALEKAMEENLLEIKKITDSPEKPSFENTIASMERSNKRLMKVRTVYEIWSSTMSDKDFQAVETEMDPKLASHSDKIIQNEQLYKRIHDVYNSSEKSKLTKEQQRLVWLYNYNFERAGAKLSGKNKERMAAINERLAGLYTKFSQNVLADEMEQKLVLKSEADLAGLPVSIKDASFKNDHWEIKNTRSSIDPFLTYSTRRDLREKAWRMFINRGDNGDQHDNNAIITEILQLRAERAKLLGYATHAHWQLDNTMAKTPEKAEGLLEAVWKPAVGRVKEEVADMQALANKEGAKITIEPWDYKFYMEKVRKAKYDLDEGEIKEYLQLDNLREGMFWVAGELFGFQFVPTANIPVNHPDVKVWEVKEKTTGKHVGLWYFDAYTREGKRSGAWMNAYRNQENMDSAVTTIVSNNSNFVKGKEGEPTLISWDDANTLFHEFGHALHGLSSNVTYSSLSGTEVVRDYVEFPSQLLEHWLSTPEVLKKFALHYKTGKPIPQELIDKIEKASKFNQGFATTEYLASAIMDMKLHLAGSQKIDPDKFEKETLSKLGMPREIVMRHRTPQFAHVFSGDGYSAGYYSYLWADVLTADAYQSFVEGKGPYDKVVADKLMKFVFSVGNTVDPAEGYRAFRGRDPEVNALMKKRGFAQ